MSFSDICIKKPIFASVLSLILILFGIVGYFKLSVSELPHIEFPIVSITTKLVGASPEIVDETVTDYIEAEINTIEGIKHIKSKSFEGFSLITAEFDQNRKIDQAAQDCRDAISRIRHVLPNDIEEPVVEKLDINAFPIMWIAASSKTLSAVEITHFADKVLRENLQKVKGVGSVNLAGEKKYALRVWLDPSRLFAHKLTVADVIQALRSQNLELPSGRIEGLTREFSIKTNAEIRSAEELRSLIITKIGPTSIRLGDLGSVEEGVEDERSLARYSGREAVGLGIVKQPSANTIDVANAVKKEILKIEQNLSRDIHIEVAFDSSVFIKKSINEVKETLWSSTLLVVLCIFAFLRNFRSTLIPAVAIPISIVSTFGLMYFFGFTLNNFTLLALVLAIGVVVDDAIVMLENIFRHIEKGMSKMEAAFLGAKEMMLPILSASLALIAVFIPIAFMQGQVGQFFYEFGMTVSIAIAVSAFVSLTLTPMLCSQFLRYKTQHSKLFYHLERFHLALELAYKKVLDKSLRRKIWFFVALTGVVAASLFFFSKLGKEFAPEEDRGSFIISFQAPEGSTLAYSNGYLKDVENILADNPYVDGFFSALALQGAEAPSVNKGLLFVQLKEDPSRPTVQEMLVILRDELQEVVGVDAWPMTFNPFAFGGQSKPFEFLLANPDYEELKESVNPFIAALQRIPGFQDVDSDLEESSAQLTLVIDRDKLSDLGITVEEISRTLNYLLSGKEATKIKKDGERYSVVVQLAKEFSRTPEMIHGLYLKSPKIGLVRLDSVVSFKEEVGASTINRRDRQKVVAIRANLDEITLQEAIEKAKQVSLEILPSSFTPMLSGEAEEMMSAFLSFFISLILAIVIIFLVLSAQFESFLYPITIMAALPLSLVGAFGGLYLFQMTLNIYSLIGMMMLMGLVTKNSILLVECSNQLRLKGMEIKEALCEAGRMRLRPILMTAASTILGILPIAFGLGAGSESRRPLGVCVIGGMLSSTLLTLFIVPALYLILDTVRLKIRKSFFRKWLDPKVDIEKTLDH